MKKPPLKEAHRFAKALELTDFNGCVQIIHEEGTVIFFHHATVRKWKGWYLVFSEHHGIHIYHEDEVLIYYFARQWEIKEV